MIIGGFQKISLIDYPGKVCAIIFTLGCPFRCAYCHNPELVLPEEFGPVIPEKEIFSFLKKRKGKLEAITISGGEPTLQPDLYNFIAKIKKMGFLVKLDSNGTNPLILGQLIRNRLINYVAMDIKGPFDKYEKIVNVKVDLEKIQNSIRMIMNSGIDYEFRTTVVKPDLSPNDFLKIGKMLKGAKLYYLQKFLPTKAVDESFLKKESYSDEEFEKIRKSLLTYVKECTLR